jgi:hypothetical protein
MLEIILALAAVLAGAGLYMWLPEGHKKWGAILTTVGGLLFLYAIILVLFAPTFSIEINFLHLWKSDSDTRAYAIVRVENRGGTNSLFNWKLTAKANDGNEYDAEVIEQQSGMIRLYTIDPEHPQPDDYSLDASQQILLETEAPMPNAEWKEGFILFIFKNVPIELLRQAGTLFTLQCTDVLNHSPIKVDFEWRGRNDHPLKYPGLKYLPVNP